ncbi:MAG: ABC transporter permease [Oscillospiraceae bacterium]|nr:ABC transporter permease [Oscillospiraceae bacterium]
MRFCNLILWDMKFQARYGFYLLYGFLTLLYAALLFSFPEAWKEKAAAILIFSDPAAMGLFFMGAVVLLEKSQRVTSFFAVSPLSVIEYIWSKTLALNIIALVVAAVLAVSVNSRSISLVLLGTFLSGILFTLLGIIIAAKIKSLNQFILATVPIEIITFVPAVLHLFGATPEFMRIYPANVCMDMICGREFSVVGLFFTAALLVIFFYAAYRSVSKMWQCEGGEKL